MEGEPENLPAVMTGETGQEAPLKVVVGTYQDKLPLFVD